jgi:hypothetical protein
VNGTPDARRDEIPSPGVTQARELLAQGPAAGAAPGPRGRIAAALRRQLRQVRRIEIAHQQRLDTTIVEAIANLSDQVRDLRHRQDDDEQRGRDRDQRAHELSLATAEMGRKLRAQVRTALNTRPYLVATPFGPLDSPVGPALGFTSFVSTPADLERGPGDFAGVRLERDSHAPYLAVLAERRPLLGLGARAAELVARLEGNGTAGPAEPTSADPLAELEGSADGSLGAVMSIQLLERLPNAAQWKLLELAVRKLRPGGVFIAESTNPHSASAMRLLAQAEQQLHPIYPEVALAMCGLTGFAPAFVFAPGHPAFEPARFIARDFAIVATRPGPGDDAG